jgi:hypothetical protein
MDKTGGHYVKWNRSGIERQILHVLSHMSMIKKSPSECRLMTTRGWEVGGERG